MNFEYTNTQQDYMAQTELICQDEFPSARSAHYFNAVFWSVLLVLAASASYIADSWILVFVFLAALVKYLHRSIPYSRLFRARVKLSQRSQPEKRIKLIVNEDGLHEEAEGIQSFAPWTSIKSYTLFRDILFVKLAGGFLKLHGSALFQRRHFLVNEFG